MEGIICVEDRYYILATSSLAKEGNRVIKEGDTFAVFDRYGDIQPVGMGEQGLFHDGTRFLSGLELFLNGVKPLLLSSGVDANNLIFTVDMANPDFCATPERAPILRETLHIFRSKLLWSGTFYEHLRLTNFNWSPVPYSISLRFAADFADIFEVRGQKRMGKGTFREPYEDAGARVLAYEGLDGALRETRIRFSPAGRLRDGEILFEGELQGKEQLELDVSFSCRVSVSEQRPVRLGYRAAVDNAFLGLKDVLSRESRVASSNEHFDELLTRSLTDLRMMTSRTEYGLYPYAGVPWYSTPFGRDGIITALQVLWLNPDMARGVLGYLAATQADSFSAENDAEPGKIIHEVRNGEMAILGEVPFRRYYGSVDSTPLFVLLAAEYFERTGDLAFIRRLWPNILRALTWIWESGDIDGDGFVEYVRKRGSGLFNQGWKDSEDSVMHADGTIAELPIALCEVQGYVYAAKRGAARLARLLGDEALVDRLEAEAEELREKFERVFWSEEMGLYALALDGEKRPCLVRSSNAGHVLFTGIVSEARAVRVAAAMMEEEFFSGWGVRTLAGNERAYNPMSYHNGSIWPHDNSLIGLGMARYGLSREAGRILGGMLDLSLFLDLHRLPELFCGFKRRPLEGPTNYPVACAPQAWASGAPLLLLQACMGLSVQAVERQIRFTRPSLPPFLDEVRISDLRVGDASVDLLLRRQDADVSIYVVNRTGKVDIVTVK